MLKVKVLILCLVIASTIAEEQVGYKFEYGVDDPHTKDHKSHYEHREGDHVVGAYSLKEPDGSLRTVHYKSGPHSGFEAVVEKTGHIQQQPEDNQGFY